jgi:hypothetical protein
VQPAAVVQKHRSQRNRQQDFQQPDITAQTLAQASGQRIPHLFGLVRHEYFLTVLVVFGNHDDFVKSLILYPLPGVGLDGQPCAYAFKDGTGAHGEKTS